MGAHQCYVVGAYRLQTPGGWGGRPVGWAREALCTGDVSGAQGCEVHEEGYVQGLRKVPRSLVLCRGAESLSPLSGSSHSLGSGFRVPKCIGMGGGQGHTHLMPPCFVFLSPLLSIPQHQLPHLPRGLSAVGV